MRKKLTKKERTARKRKYDLIRKYYNVAMSKADKETQNRITYKRFKNRIRFRMETDNVDLKTALKKEINTETYTTAAERSRTNLIESLKEDFKSDYDKLRNLSREKGRFKALKENLEWSTEFKGYLVGGRYLIDVTNSPEQVIITDIQTGATV